MSSLALSDSFEYLCYGSTAIRIFFYSYSAKIDFSRQNLTSTDVKFCLSEVDPRTIRVNRPNTRPFIFFHCYPHSHLMLNGKYYIFRKYTL